MRCLVTGASGFVGSALVPKLLARGHHVVILVRHSSDLTLLEPYLPQLDLLYGDLLHFGTQSLPQEINLGKLDAVFHLAWFGVTAEFRNDPDQIRTNLVATLELWNSAKKAGCRIWIGLGSQAEYGRVDHVLREDTPTAPVTAYGVAKLAAGLTTAKMSEICGMRHVWLRLLSAYGPGDDERHMIPSVIQAFLARRRPALTLGEQMWDYIYVDDVAEALCAVLETETSGIYNLGSGSAITLRTVVEKIRDLIDPCLSIGFGEIPYRPDQVMFLEADISNLCAATSWQPKTSLVEGLTQTIAWTRKRIPLSETR
ncbi:NAD-dependent epimerase/dehydratase family protein [Edaphobacter albus]|uniref:NAD-dependent epimerase/dehydratase family protein n=1 Tax=Edaphobacter sp. 4G125 TaxID=2763071 RepID=UPI0016468CC7|nr:NAD(P)-dependent oxidoreductase [Edaphobacter sp. 4G125]QNI37182.1 NAD(P)-dependent oxidoreductase [Edaphobacter sp. 4G125]